MGDLYAYARPSPLSLGRVDQTHRRKNFKFHQIKRRFMRGNFGCGIHGDVSPARQRVFGIFRLQNADLSILRSSGRLRL